MGKKEELKLKQQLKKQAKAERQKIVTKYISEIKNIIDNGYLDMALDLEDFNKELEASTIKYSEIQMKIISILKLDNIEDMNLGAINELMDIITETEKKNEEIYKTITSRDINENKLLKRIPGIAEQVSTVIQKVIDDLDGQKNMEYIKSMVINESFNLFKKYNQDIVDTALESNDYIDLYIDARENFVDFISKSQQYIEDKIINEETEEVIETIKHKQRLRVNYDDLTAFLKYKGFECNRQGSTTHAVWKNKETGISVPLPNKSGTIPQGTTSKVLKQMGSNRNELANFLYA